MLQTAHTEYIALGRNIIGIRHLLLSGLLPSAEGANSLGDPLEREEKLQVVLQHSILAELQELLRPEKIFTHRTEEWLHAPRKLDMPKDAVVELYRVQT